MNVKDVSTQFNDKLERLISLSVGGINGLTEAGIATKKADAVTRCLAYLVSVTFPYVGSDDKMAAGIYANQILDFLIEAHEKNLPKDIPTEGN